MLQNRCGHPGGDKVVQVQQEISCLVEDAYGLILRTRGITLSKVLIQHVCTHSIGCCHDCNTLDCAVESRVSM